MNIYVDNHQSPPFWFVHKQITSRPLRGNGLSAHTHTSWYGNLLSQTPHLTFIYRYTESIYASILWTLSRDYYFCINHKHCCNQVSMNLWNTVTIWSVQISLLTNMQFFLNLPTSCSFPPSKSASSFLLSAIEKEQLLCHLWKAEQGLPFLWEKELPIIGNTFTSATSLNKWRKQFSQKV